MPRIADISQRHLPDLSDASLDLSQSFSFQIPTSTDPGDDLLRTTAVELSGLLASPVPHSTRDAPPALDDALAPSAVAPKGHTQMIPTTTTTKLQSLIPTTRTNLHDAPHAPRRSPVARRRPLTQENSNSVLKTTDHTRNHPLYPSGEKPKSQTKLSAETLPSAKLAASELPTDNLTVGIARLDSLDAPPCVDARVEMQNTGTLSIPTFEPLSKKTASSRLSIASAPSKARPKIAKVAPKETHQAGAEESTLASRLMMYAAQMMLPTQVGDVEISQKDCADPAHLPAGVKSAGDAGDGDSDKTGDADGGEKDTVVVRGVGVPVPAATGEIRANVSTSVGGDSVQVAQRGDNGDDAQIIDDQKPESDAGAVAGNGMRREEARGAERTDISNEPSLSQPSQRKHKTLPERGQEKLRERATRKNTGTVAIGNPASKSRGERTKKTALTKAVALKPSKAKTEANAIVSEPVVPAADSVDGADLQMDESTWGSGTVRNDDAARDSPDGHRVLVAGEGVGGDDARLMNRAVDPSSRTMYLDPVAESPAASPSRPVNDAPLTLEELSPRKPAAGAGADGSVERVPSPLHPSVKRPASAAAAAERVKRSKVMAIGAAPPRVPSVSARGRGRARVVSAPVPPRAQPVRRARAEAEGAAGRSVSTATQRAVSTTSRRSVSASTATSRAWQRSVSASVVSASASASTRRARTPTDATTSETLAGEAENSASTTGPRSAKPYTVPDFAALHASFAAQTALRRSRAPTIPHAPALSTDVRARERAAFDAEVRERERAREEERMREKAEREAAEAEELKEMRKRAVPRAHEVPEWYAEAPRRGKESGDAAALE